MCRNTFEECLADNDLYTEHRQASLLTQKELQSNFDALQKSQQNWERSLFIYFSCIVCLLSFKVISSIVYLIPNCSGTFLIFRFNIVLMNLPNLLINAIKYRLFYLHQFMQNEISSTAVFFNLMQQLINCIKKCVYRHSFFN